MSMKSGGYDARAPKEVKKPKKLSHIEVHPSENGGHLVKHVFEHFDHESEMHTFGKGEGKAMLAHVSRTMDVPSHKEGAQPRNANDDAVSSEPDGKVEATV